MICSRNFSRSEEMIYMDEDIEISDNDRVEEVDDGEDEAFLVGKLIGG